MRFVNISIGTMDSFLMNKTVQEVRDMGYDIDYRNFDNTDLDEDPLFLADAVQFISGADFVTIKVHGDTSYCKKFDKIRDALNRVDHEDTLGKKVFLKGDIVPSYYGIVGIQSISEYSF